MLDVGTVGIEGAAAPGEHVLVLLVGRIGDRGEEFGIAPGPAHVLGRAAARCGDELRVEGLRVGFADALDPDGVVPAVAKVVEIMDRPGTGILGDVEECCLRCRQWSSSKSGSGTPQPAPPALNS